MFDSIFDGLKADLAFLKNGVDAGVPVDFQLTAKQLGMSQKQFEEFAEAAGARIDPRTKSIIPEDANLLLQESYDYMTKAIPGKTGEIIRLPTRITIGIDEYFKARLRNQKTMALVSRKASMDEAAGKGSYEDLFKEYKKKAFGGPEADRLEYAERIEKLFGDTEGFDTALFDIRNYATDGTFQTKLTGGMEAISKFRGEGNTLTSTFATQVLPFLRTPWNLAKEGVSYVPGLGLAFKPGVTKTTANYTIVDGIPIAKFKTEVVNMSKEEMVARQLMGLGAVVGLGALFNADRLTGSIPNEPAERERWKANGIQPFSIKVGDKWVSYQRVEPLATVMGLAADTFTFTKQYKTGKIPVDPVTGKPKIAEEALATSWSNLKSNILEKTFLQGFADMVGSMDSEQKLIAYFENMAKRVVPALSATVARAIDPYEREAIGLKEKLQQRVPGMREQLPKSYATYSQEPEGPPTPRKTNIMQAVTGIAVADEPTPFQKRMNELGVSFAPKSSKMGGRDLTSQELSDYKFFINEQATKIFGGAINNLEKLPNDQLKKTVAKNIMSKITAGARAKLRSKYPELSEAIMKQNRYDKFGVLD
jgi:hypothetical protein